MKAFEIRKATLGKFALAITGLSLLVAQAMSISPAWADGGLGEAPDLEKPPAEVQDPDGNGTRSTMAAASVARSTSRTMALRGIALISLKLATAVTGTKSRTEIRLSQS